MSVEKGKVLVFHCGHLPYNLCSSVFSVLLSKLSINLTSEKYLLCHHNEPIHQASMFAKCCCVIADCPFTLRFVLSRFLSSLCGYLRLLIS